MESGRIGSAGRGSQGVINSLTPDGCRGWERTDGVFTGMENVYYRWLDACCSTRSLDVMPLDYNSAVSTCVFCSRG